MQHPSTYRNRRVVVLGLARSGVSVAKVFHALGADTIASDVKPREQCPEAEELAALGISVLCGGHPEGLVTPDTALVVKNPGIPYTSPPVREALELGLEVVTEVEVAWWLTEAPIIGITGSNGKTTTTTMIGRLLEAAGRKTIVAGNIGRPLTDAAREADASSWLVAELSSFQLKGTVDFRPRIAVLTNVAETHLDYHGGMDDYTASKAKLFANQTEDDVAVVNWDDPECRRLVSGAKPKVMPFAIRQRLEEGVFVDPPYPESPEDDGLVRSIVRRAGGETTVILPVDELGVPGRHNAANAAAAAAAALAAGVPIESLAEPLRTFRGVEHRLEFVREKAGVRFYNSSKDTNPTATTMALRSVKGPVVLLCGGLDRGTDYADLVPVLREKVKALVAIGETRMKLAAAAEAAGVRLIRVIEPEASARATLERAVREAGALAEPGDAVLLSPACASWDMFPSYEERGRIFKEAAHIL
jgi:UDP-N-acetylmuramoylalanine--D-glutamate ligase